MTVANGGKMAPETILKAMVAERTNMRHDTYETRLRQTLDASRETWDVDAHAVAFAELFYLLLAGCQKLYCPADRSSDGVPIEIWDSLLTVLDNINRVDMLEGVLPDKPVESKRLVGRPGESYVQVVRFLGGLKFASEHNEAHPPLDGEWLLGSADSLLDVLNDIEFVFNVKSDDGVPVFPIERLLSHAVEGILRNGRRVRLEDVHLLRLAVKLFGDTDESDGGKKLLDELADTCNLKFIDLLRSDCCWVDAPDKRSFKLNGSMVFWDSCNQRVLVRHERRGYFTDSEIYRALSGGMPMVVEDEKDRNGQVIGHFVTWRMSSGGASLSADDLVKDVEGARRLLELVFDWGAYNILVDRALVKGEDGMVYPVNPWCVNDSSIVVDGNLAGSRFYRREEIASAFERYRILPVDVNRRCPLNYVTFGLCAFLLSVRNTGVSALRLGQMGDDSWYQEQVLLRWASYKDETEQRGVSADDVRIVFEHWYKEIEYCRAGSFESQEFKIVDFLPLAQSKRSLYELMAPDCDEGAVLLCGVVSSSDSGEELLVVMPERTFASSGAGAFEMTSRRIAADVVDGIAEYMEDVEAGDELYFLYSAEAGKGSVVDQHAARMFAEIEKIHHSPFSLFFDVGKHVSPNRFEVVSKRMMLFEDAFKQHARTCLANDFGMRSVFALRLLHNLIWSGVTSESVADYFDVIEHHQILDYAGIANDEVFALAGEGVLYVPKDKREADAALCVLFDVVLRDYSARRAHDPYCDSIEPRDGGEGSKRYFVPGENVPIERIVLLTDNIMSGSATCDVLAAHFGIKGASASAMSRIMKYRSVDNGGVVTLKDVVESNGASVEVHAYYATEAGCKAVDDFLSDQGIPFHATSCAESIVSFADCVFDRAKAIWGRKFRDNERTCREDVCAVIRKYNMPKALLFPPAMTDDARRFICLFVKKRERML